MKRRKEEKGREEKDSMFKYNYIFKWMFKLL